MTVIQMKIQQNSYHKFFVPAFSLLYLKTKSLRLPILTHFLSDLGNLSIFLFMNMVTM